MPTTIYLPLPWVSERLGRRAVVATRVLFTLAADQVERPEDAVVLFRARWPRAFWLASMPAMREQLDRARDLAWERWADGFLGETLRAQLEDLVLLGEDRVGLTIGLLRVWGWLPEPDRTRPRLPNEHLRETVTALADRLHRSPYELLCQRVPVFAVNVGVLIESGARADRDDAPPDAGLIGIEKVTDGR